MPLWTAYARALRGQVFIHLDRVEEGIDLITAAGRVYDYRCHRLPMAHPLRRRARPPGPRRRRAGLAQRDRNASDRGRLGRVRRGIATLAADSC